MPDPSFKPATSPSRQPARAQRLLGGLPIRNKLLLLHTVFSLLLLAFMAVVLRPAVREVVDRAESTQAMVLANGLAKTFAASSGQPSTPAVRAYLDSLRDVQADFGTAASLNIPDDTAARVRAEPTSATAFTDHLGRAAAAILIPAAGNDPERFAVVSVQVREAREAVTRLYIFTVLTLLGVYGFIAAALELFVLPQAVYEPIRRMQEADLAVQEGRTERELIPEEGIPNDELGEIMRSRNDSIVALRRQEQELAQAFAQVEEVAGDLKKKNYLLETAQRNLADAERLAGLGMMSAGIAHELNTPLAVLKGSVEEIAKSPQEPVPADRAALMLRVVHRLERLSESLLDFARVRPPQVRPARLRELIDEALMLVKLDRGISAAVHNTVSDAWIVHCDGDRIVQVLVNILRNARDALREGTAQPVIDIAARESMLVNEPAVTLTIADNGPGIDPAILPKLFEPFASTRLDSRGTGLGLAVAEGIVREHGGTITAQNHVGYPGAEFQITLKLGQA